MEELERDHWPSGQNLYLIELPAGNGRVNYCVCERIVTVRPEKSALDIPWSELAELFKGQTLRAVPMPGRTHFDDNSRGASTRRGVSENGASTKVEVNFIKVERKSD